MALNRDTQPQPAAGDVSDVETLAYWFDADGQPCEAADAVTGELVELVGGYEVRRTYVDRREDGRNLPLEVPADTSPLDPENQDDMVKAATWDLWDYQDGEYFSVTTLEQLLRVWGIDGKPEPEQRQFVGKMMGLPMWVPAPIELREEVNAWLMATRQ